MVLSLLKYLGGYLRVRLSGYAPERFLNLCSNHNILIWNLEKCEDDYLFYISVKAFRQIKPFLRKTKTKVFILSKTGLPFYLHRYRKRKLFFAGILLAAAMLFLLSRFIWNVEIEGNSKVTDATLLQVLETYHCGYGTAKHTINCEEVERQLREDFPDIIWSSVRISGTKLTVTIKENLLMEQVESQSTYEYSDLIAAHDAVVDSIITRKGTPCVKVGDSVAAGDVLVSGRIDIMNDNGEVSAYEYCNCDADIYLIEVLDYEKSFPLLHEVQKKTGNSQNRYSLIFFGNELSLFNREKPYENFKESTEYKQLLLYKNFYVPISIRKEYDEEYETKQESYSKEEAELKAYEEFEQYLEDLSQKNIQILEKNVMIDILEKECVAQGTIKVRRKADTRQETQLLEINIKDEGLVTDELE